ncbi:LPS export ABC transporter permease LptG [Craterilacuibacter sp.]|uniref:LPS export ABC transporter permease LptG n=1 Tax=Craterilacuibacter sp. TaxID=2870909 RepID=UPI003F389C34
MKQIRNYLFANFVSASLFTLIALIGLYAFFDVIKELPRIGRGSYDIVAMLAYVALLIPGHAYELMPLAVLIGCMVAMTQLSSSSEYAAIRTSGVSLAQIAGIMLSFGSACALIALLLGEFVSPWSEQTAEKFKLDNTRSVVAQEFRSGLWAKDDNNFINIGEMLPDATLLNIRVYTYDQQFKLTRSRHAQRATYEGNGYWKLEGVRDSNIEPDRIRVETFPTLQWKSVLQPDILSVLLVVPEQMSAYNLKAYIDHLRANHQKTQRYEIALWSKLFYPLACISMALVALAFTPVSRRHGEMGVKLFTGICLGIGFHFTNRLFGHLGLLYDWNPIFSATAPTLLFLMAGIWAITHQERR